MNAYIYKAALLCQRCGDRVKSSVKPPAGYDPRNEHTWDSDEYPKGPYPNGGGESDSPEHCDQCGVFLENPLTSDGYAYVEDAVRNTPNATTKKWADFYHIQLEGKADRLTSRLMEAGNWRQIGPATNSHCDCEASWHETLHAPGGCTMPATTKEEMYGEAQNLCDICAEDGARVRLGMEVFEGITEKEAEFRGHLAGTEDWSAADQKDAYDAYVGMGKYADKSRQQRMRAIELLHRKYDGQMRSTPDGDVRESLTEGIFDASLVQSYQGALDAIMAGVRAPYVRTQLSTLGGKDRASIMIAVSLDPKDKWVNNIFENSRYFRCSLSIDGTLTYFSGPVKFRQTRVSSVENAITRLNTIIGRQGE